MTKARAAVVLAAGEGTRMQSGRAKVLHELGGHPLVEHVVRQVVRSGIETVVVVVGHQGAEVKAALRDFHREVTCVEQKERLGTGHAVDQALPFLRGTWSEHVLVLAGDAPFLRGDTMRALADGHDAGGAAVTVLTADLDDPTGYGRIVRDAAGVVEAIVEDKDASPAVLAIHEINSGIYAFDIEALVQSLRQVTNRNAQAEYYLTDTLSILRGSGRRVAAVKAADPVEVLGINTREQLEAAEILYRERLALHTGDGW